MTSAKDYILTLNDFSRKFLANLYRSIKSNLEDNTDFTHMDKFKAKLIQENRRQALEIYSKHIDDLAGYLQTLKEVRKVIESEVPKRLVLDRSIIPAAHDPYSLKVSLPDRKENFISSYLVYIFTILNNDAYMDLVSEKVPNSILKIQRLIKSRGLVRKSQIDFLQLAILYANFAFLLVSSQKYKVALSFSAKALKILEDFDVESWGLSQHRSKFLFQNMQLFMM